MYGVASVSSGTESATSSSMPTNACGVAAPMRTVVAAEVDALSSSIREMSMRLSKCVSRMASIGTRL